MVVRKIPEVVARNTLVVCKKPVAVDRNVGVEVDRNVGEGALQSLKTNLVHIVISVRDYVDVQVHSG